MEWNEDNFDMSPYPYALQAYGRRKYAFVSDVARLHALSQMGGIYMDMDVEIINSPLEILASGQGVLGFESDELVSTAFIATTPHNPLIESLLADYRTRSFLKSDGTEDTTVNVRTLSARLKDFGMLPTGERQSAGGFEIYPQEYFSPKSYITGKIHTTSRTVCIHHFSGSWEPKSRHLYRRARTVVLDLFGIRTVHFLGKIRMLFVKE